jgi:NADH-quinone oxidoreductase subunit C
VAKFLKKAPAFDCKYLRCLSGVDYTDHIQLVYNLSSMHSGVNVYLKVDLPRDVEMPEVESVTDVWATANWHEREIYDLLGVRFLNHPDLRRILMPEDFTGGFPLRKDFVDERPPRERKTRKR